jgi:hypothetical protein
MKVRALYIAVCLYALTCACGSAPDAPPLCFDFEGDADLDRLRWHCKTMYTRSREHATQGLFSLKIDFYPSEYPRFEPLFDEQDWSKYKELCFDVYNPQNSVVTLTLRIDDDITRPDFYDCYIEQVRLQPGHNSVVVELKNLIGCKTKRHLQSAAVHVTSTTTVHLFSGSFLSCVIMKMCV